jgi:hypothetical protein
MGGNPFAVKINIYLYAGLIPQLLTSVCFRVYHYAIPPFDAMKSGLLTASLNKPEINKIRTL